MIRRPPRSTLSSSSAASDVYKRQPDLFFSSSIVPITSTSPQKSHTHTGIGIPQYLWREMHQSREPLTQSAKRAEPAQSGYHFTFFISSSICSLISVIFRNHCSVARYIIGVLHLQQFQYLWVIFPLASKRPFSVR